MDTANKAEPVADVLGDELLDDLRAIVTGPDRERIGALEARIVELEHRTNDRGALVAAISPILGDAIRRQVREDRDEMVESLYPLIGRLITRAVAESIRELARTIDRRMRTSLSLAYFLRRMRARAAGVSDAELILRDMLPFQVTELFLVHRASGLLLLHLSHDHPDAAPGEADDSDLVSSMLTAIRDFAQDTFGRGQEGQLDEIQYGNRRILIESCQHVALAAVVDGVEPAGFRAKLRERTIEVENAYVEVLRQYDGDASQFSPVRPDIAALLEESAGDFEPDGLSSGQKRILILMGAVLTLCIAGACLGSVVAARRALNRPAYLIVVTATPGPTSTPTSTPPASPTATATPSASPTASASPTVTASPTATALPTATITPTRTRGPAPIAEVIVVANLRQGPNLTSPVLERAPVGRSYTVSARDPTGGWLQVCCTTGGDTAWLAAALVTLRGNIEDVPITSGE